MPSKKSIPMQIGEIIAHDIFANASQVGQPVTRIQFKTGQYPNDERDLGGMNEKAFAQAIAESLAAIMGESP